MAGKLEDAIEAAKRKQEAGERERREALHRHEAASLAKLMPLLSGIEGDLKRHGMAWRWAGGDLRIGRKDPIGFELGIRYASGQYWLARGDDHQESLGGTPDRALEEIAKFILEVEAYAEKHRQGEAINAEYREGLKRAERDRRSSKLLKILAWTAGIYVAVAVLGRIFGLM